MKYRKWRDCKFCSLRFNSVNITRIDTSESVEYDIISAILCEFVDFIEN